MFIYKRFDSSKHLDDVQYQSLKIYGMASVRNGQDTPFVECATKAQAEEAKKQGRQIVAIRAIPFIVPFTSLGTEIHETHSRVNVSGAVTLRIDPNASFRDYVLSHPNGELTTDQLTEEFAKGLELNLEPTLKHVVNTDDVEQLRKHGAEAADVSGLQGALPSWCEVVKVQLAVDGTDTASRYTQQVAKALAEQEKAAQIEQDKLMNRIKDIISTGTKKDYGTAIDTVSEYGLVGSIIKFIGSVNRKTYLWLVKALIGAWALTWLVYALGGGVPFARACRFKFEGENSASSKIQKSRFETYMSKQFSQNKKSKDKPFETFKWESKFRLSDDDAERVSGWVNSYLEDPRHKGAVEQKEMGDKAYNYPYGVKKILGISKPHYNCTIKLVGKPEIYHLVVKNDYDDTVKQRLDALFKNTPEGKKKKGFTEYSSLKLRSADVKILEQELMNDETLADKNISVLHDKMNPHEITVTVGNYMMNYHLDVSELLLFEELLDEIKYAIQTATPNSREIFFKQKITEDPIRFNNSEVEMVQKLLKAKDRVVCIREGGEEGKTERLVFKMSEKERTDRGLKEMDKQKTIGWWQNDEPRLLDAVMDKAKRLEQAVAAVKVPEDATDADYAALLDRIQTLRAQRQTAVEELNHLLNQIKDYQTGMEKGILKKATAHQQQLEGQTASYTNMKEQLDNLTTKIHNARWEAKAHREIARRREAAGRYATEVEQALRNAQTAFRQEIPNAVPIGQTKESYGNLEAVAQRWEERCRETFKGIENYRNTELKDTFMLENRTATWDAKAYRNRLNAVLEGWSFMCHKSMDCKAECQYRQVEAMYLKNQTEFWKNVNALDAIQKGINGCKDKLKAIRQSVAGMTREEIRARRGEIQTQISQEVQVPAKVYEKDAEKLTRYFSDLLESSTYRKELGDKFPEVQILSESGKVKIKELIKLQQNKLIMKAGSSNWKECLSYLQKKAESSNGEANNLFNLKFSLENDDILVERRIIIK